MLRLFAAIRIQPGAALAEMIGDLTRRLVHDKINWVALHNVHITLKFFGETPEERLPEITASLHRVSERNHPFSLQLFDAGIFGSYYKPRVIWIGIRPNPGLITLTKDLLTELETLGFEQDHQNFIPHVTIARIRYTENKKLLNSCLDPYRNRFFQEEDITEFHLYKSILSNLGPTYSVLNSFRLK